MKIHFFHVPVTPSKRQRGSGPNPWTERQVVRKEKCYHEHYHLGMRPGGRWESVATTRVRMLFHGDPCPQNHQVIGTLLVGLSRWSQLSSTLNFLQYLFLIISEAEKSSWMFVFLVITSTVSGRFSNFPMSMKQKGKIRLKQGNKAVVTPGGPISLAQC